jgi:hypothetical protein
MPDREKIEITFHLSEKQRDDAALDAIDSLIVDLLIENLKKTEGDKHADCLCAEIDRGKLDASAEHRRSEDGDKKVC